ncbi:MAG: hypothetical protein IT368_18840 [Candidatus Hydrogenedentes bacterium]|nr:hypothetical protein [Candidatus Hydrogenedentota bacterium]
MAGIAGVAGAVSGIQSLKFEAEYQARVLATQKDVMELQGNMALQLIQSAGVDPAVGGNINIQV